MKDRCFTFELENGHRVSVVGTNLLSAMGQIPRVIQVEVVSCVSVPYIGCKKKPSGEKAKTMDN